MIIPKLIRLMYYKAPAVDAVKPYKIPPHMMVIELVTDGVIRFCAENGEEARFGCGALFWHIAGEETIHRTDAAAPYECLAISFSMPRQTARPAPKFSIIADHQRARELVDELLAAYHDEQMNHAVFGQYAYARMLWEAQLSLLQRAHPLQPATIKTALDFLEAQFYRAEIGVADLAESAGVSEPHLHMLFREHVGQSPHQYLVARRIREAKRTLAKTSANIKSIASDCGFANIETFYRAFKRTVGTTPRQFRQSNTTRILEQ